MLKLKIVMDEEKVMREGRYDLSVMQSTIDSIFINHGLPRRNDGTYTGTGRTDDYAKFWHIIWALAKKEWFIKNVKEWLWYNSDDGRDENDFAVEDILAFCKANRAETGT